MIKTFENFIQKINEEWFPTGPYFVSKDGVVGELVQEDKVNFKLKCIRGGTKLTNVTDELASLLEEFTKNELPKIKAFVSKKTEAKKAWAYFTSKRNRDINIIGICFYIDNGEDFDNESSLQKLNMIYPISKVEKGPEGDRQTQITLKFISPIIITNEMIQSCDDIIDAAW